SPKTASSAPNPLIPSTISPKCEAFLTYLNSHQDISTCTAPLLSALSTFQASAASNDYAANDAAVQDALAGLCYSAPCDDSLVRSLLTQFNSNCTAELTASNDVVLGSYDALYVLTPLRDAVCSTDSTADWCINDIAKGSMPAGSTGANATHVVSSSFDVPSILPNAATWSSASLPFLFLSPSMSSTVLCSQCTKSILSAYVAWESRMPYALGLANSPLLKGQGSLWTATGEKCGGGFLESVTKQAG
ncbi:uncharacterized protein RHOBADRAFT_1111, partial [Rhodotorula graminis WP1]